ncbi:MAG TPA: hypothetical protein VE842_08875 [Pyrinomonadaceae bacterium]|jgi:hypothetical protein|nr:hypothetical protein [Pyrinomonadaceae bacterium]
MTEAKIVLPAYIKIGICSGCGASVYAPEKRDAEGGLPSMSACACAGGPGMSVAAGEDDSGRGGEEKSEKIAKAA